MQPCWATRNTRKQVPHTGTSGYSSQRADMDEGNGSEPTCPSDTQQVRSASHYEGGCAEFAIGSDPVMDALEHTDSARG